MSAFCSGLCNEISRCCYDFYHTPFTKKNLLIAGGVLGGLIILIVIIVVATSGSSKITTAEELLKQYPLVDGANSLSRNIKMYLRDELPSLVGNLPTQLKTKGCEKTCQTDIERMKSGHVATQIFSVTSDCKAKDKDAVSQTLEQIDLLTRMAHNYNMSLILKPADILSSFNSHTIGVMINVWGGHNIDSRLAVLRTYYRLGVRVMSLVAGDPEDKDEKKICYPSWIDPSNGLTDFGKGVIEEMNRLGMIIDLTGMSYNATMNVLGNTKAPVIFSHSASYSLIQHPFNINKDFFDKGKKMHVMVPFTKSQLVTTSSANISDVVNHMNDLKKNSNDNVTIGIGSNFDNMTDLIKDLDDVSKFVNLIKYLMKDHNDDSIVKLMASNFINTFNEVDIMGKKLQTQKKSDVQPDYYLKNLTCYTDWDVRYPSNGTGPTSKPNDKPTKPTDKPTDKPTEKPTDKPTEIPKDKPTDKPTTKPTP